MGSTWSLRNEKQKKAGTTILSTTGANLAWGLTKERERCVFGRKNRDASEMEQKNGVSREDRHIMSRFFKVSS